MHIPPFFLVFVMHLRELTRGTQLNKGKTVRWEILQSKHGQILQNAGKYFKVNTDSKETAQNSIPSHLLQKNMKVGRMRWASEKLTHIKKMPKFAILGIPSFTFFPFSFLLFRERLFAQPLFSSRRLCRCWGSLAFSLPFLFRQGFHSVLYFWAYFVGFPSCRKSCWGIFVLHCSEL